MEIGIFVGISIVNHPAIGVALLETSMYWDTYLYVISQPFTVGFWSLESERSCTGGGPGEEHSTPGRSVEGAGQKADVVRAARNLAKLWTTSEQEQQQQKQQDQHQHQH